MFLFPITGSAAGSELFRFPPESDEQKRAPDIPNENSRESFINYIKRKYQKKALSDKKTKF